jgi:hypothetical protein
MGVTFKAGLMIMEPGHAAASFIQRIGRVARGDLPGDVVVVASAAKLARDAWSRRLLQVLPGGGGTVPVDRLVELVLSSLGERFKASAEELLQEVGRFRTMPQAAAWCAGLFWTALERSAFYKGAGSIRHFAPQQARFIGSQIRTLDESASPAAKLWAKTMLHEARRLRMILPYVKVIDSDGVAKRYSWTLYDGTPWLARLLSSLDEKRNLVVSMDMTHDEAAPLLGGRPPVRQEATLAPHSSRSKDFEVAGLREAYVRWLGHELEGIDLRPEARVAIEAARKIVRLTGVVPTLETAEAASDASGII